MKRNKDLVVGEIHGSVFYIVYLHLRMIILTYFSMKDKTEFKKWYTVFEEGEHKPLAMTGPGMQGKNRAIKIVENLGDKFD